MQQRKVLKMSEHRRINERVFADPEFQKRSDAGRLSYLFDLVTEADRATTLSGRTRDAEVAFFIGLILGVGGGIIVGLMYAGAAG